MMARGSGERFERSPAEFAPAQARKPASGQVLARVRVAAAQEVPRADHGEGHGALPAVGYPGEVAPLTDAEDLEVRCGVQGATPGIDPGPLT
jgi:hypothetical protein